ncbi:MT-A70 family methyltransferase [Photobacterium sp. OFAV2-7]|uniref:MT-A70 family methyltransferase n=1 Tax=Photobacterium sp. OFAV2-7 TaxID=2917748 RepID=UPI001EF637A5|nr:MT-A70 family methyltransferase [Photobacterium sp. OFAV2-7]MCG7588282.1 MT-A70 family methyltransferase [Photobacterium sp. OFAV2-7]
MKYPLIYCDPPWKYNNKVSNGAAQNHYEGMTLAEMCALPVNNISADDSVLAMWYTGNFVDEAMFLAKAWGFKIKTMKGFTWAKLNEKYWSRVGKAINQGNLTEADFLALLNSETRMNGGNYTRANSEDCLIAIKGKGLERKQRNIKQLVIAPLDEHSAKPPEVRHRLERLYGDIPRLEMFARTSPQGWDVFGNEVSNSIQLHHAA